MARARSESSSKRADAESRLDRDQLTDVELSLVAHLVELLGRIGTGTVALSIHEGRVAQVATTETLWIHPEAPDLSPDVEERLTTNVEANALSGSRPAPEPQLEKGVDR